MTEVQRPLKVFLCHASQDKPQVRELSRRLHAEGWIDPWLDEKKLLPGQDWRMNIEEAVESSDIIIICLSDNSVTKEGFVQKEIRYAREIALEKPEETIFIVPLRLDECAVPRGLRFYQWVDYFGEKKDEAYRVLLESLKWRYNQKARIEEAERARQEKIKAEREVAEKADREKAAREVAEMAAREKAEREAAEKFAREKAEQEATEKSFREKLEREVAEKALREKVEREATEKAAREKAEREAAEKAAHDKAEHDVAQKAAGKKAAREKEEREAAEKAAKEKKERDAAEKAARDKVAHEATEKVRREQEKQQPSVDKAEPRKPKPRRTPNTSGVTIISGIGIAGVVGFVGFIGFIFLISALSSPNNNKKPLQPIPTLTRTSSPPVYITYAPILTTLPSAATDTSVPTEEMQLSATETNSTVVLSKITTKNSDLVTLIGTIRTWETLTYLSISPNGKILAVATYSGVVLYETITLAELLSITVENNARIGPSAIAFSPDGSIIAGTGNGVIYFWNVHDGSIFQTFTGYARKIAFSPDGKYFVSVDSADEVRLWNISDGSSSILLGGSSGNIVQGLDFSPDSKTLAIGTYNGWSGENPIIYLWNISSNRYSIIREFGRDLAYSPDGDMLVGANKETDIWLVSDNSLKQTLGVSSDEVEFSPDGDILATGGDKYVRLWQVSDGALLKSLHDDSDNSEYMVSMIFSPNGTVLATSSSDGIIRIWGVKQ